MNDDGPAGERGRRTVDRGALARYFLHLASAEVDAVPAGETPLSTKVIVVLNVSFLATQPVELTMANFFLPFLFLALSVVVSDFRPAQTPGIGCCAWSGI